MCILQRTIEDNYHVSLSSMSHLLLQIKFDNVCFVDTSHGYTYFFSYRLFSTFKGNKNSSDYIRWPSSLISFIVTKWRCRKLFFQLIIIKFKFKFKYFIGLEIQWLDCHHKQYIQKKTKNKKHYTIYMQR